VACFERYGVQRTRVEDAANAAGISGTNFYNFFPSRAALIEAVVLRRVEAIVGQVAPTIARASNLSEALAEGAAGTVEACRHDEVFLQLLRLTGNKRLGEIGLEPSAFGHDMLVRLWQPALEVARERGELRTELTDDQNTVAWLGSVLLMFVLNDRLSPAQIKATVAAYVAPALVADRR
jgi:AcrR family transcriptional regulator